VRLIAVTVAARLFFGKELRDLGLGLIHDAPSPARRMEAVRQEDAARKPRYSTPNRMRDNPHLARLDVFRRCREAILVFIYVLVEFVQHSRKCRI